METDTSLTIKDVAKYLNISNQMVYNLIKAQEIPAFKIGAAVRVLQSDLAMYIQNRKTLFSAQNRDLSNPDDTVFAAQSLFIRAGSFQIENVSFSFPRGKIMALLGASGSGKTILLKGLAGIIVPEAGGVFLGRKRLDALPLKEQHIGFVYQDYALYPAMRSKENIGFPLRIMNLDKAQLDRKVMEVVHELRIDDTFLTKYPDELPEGIKQLIAIGRERTHVMDLYIMDEPMSHLDAHVRVAMRGFIKQIVTKLGKTTIIAVNSPEDALVLSDYTAVMDRGRLIQFGPTQEVYFNPKNLTVMNNLSANGVNCLTVSVRNGRVDPFGIVCGKPDGNYIMAFRPEEVEVAESGISAEVVKAVFYYGDLRLADCRTEDKKDLRLIIPSENEETVTFVPTRPVFFPL